MATKPRLRVRPSAFGYAWAGLCGATLGVALVSGNNLLYLVAAPLLAVLAVDVMLGAWNLRGVRVARELPDELFSGHEARGRVRVHNRRNLLSSRALRVSEVGIDGAWARVDLVEPGQAVAAPLGWSAAARGLLALRGLEVASAWPFGIAERSLVLPAPAEVWVYPRPVGPTAMAESGGDDAPGDDGRRGGGTGDFVGLRDYVPGDPIRSVHWATSARRGSAVVVVRADEEAERVVVRVRDLDGVAWERELSRACAQVIHAFRRRFAVTLEIGDDRLGPGSDGAFRREVLERLAREPGR